MRAPKVSKAALPACTCIAAEQPCTAPQETEQLDGGGAAFLPDRWERPGAEPGAGYGITCMLEGGDLLEKVHGRSRKSSASQQGDLRSYSPSTALAEGMARAGAPTPRHAPW